MSATPIDFSDKSKQSIFKALYEHGKLNRDAPPLRVCDVEDIAKRAGFHSFKKAHKMLDYRDSFILE